MNPGVRMLRRELLARRGMLVRLLAWSVLEAAPALISGWAIARATDRFVAHDASGGLAWLALLLLAGAAGAFATRRMFPWLARVVEPIRDACLTAVVGGAVRAAVCSDRTSGSVQVAQLSEQVQAVREILFAILRVIRQVAFTVLASLVGLALLAPAVALITVVPVAVALTLFARSLRGLAARQYAVLLAQEEVGRRAGTVVDGLRDALACGAEDRAAAFLGAAVDAEADLTRGLARAAVRRHLVIFLGAQLPLITVFLAAPVLVGDRLTTGQLIGAATYLVLGLEPALRRLVEVLATWGLEMAISIRRLGETFTDAPPPDAGADRNLAAGADLVVHGLTFRYGPHAEPIVRDLDLALPEGEHLAVVGPSGIGKSTLANLLTGLLTPQHGTIRLGGTALDRVPEQRLRHMVALIPQEAYVFAGTLRENLTYLAPEATDDDIAAAAREVGLAPLIDALGGPDAVLGPGGVQLSAGEKQLVALTRVHLSPARLVVLDEATSALDPEAEARAERAFHRRPGTVVVIAHRISSARRAGRILLLGSGSVLLASHDELARTSPLYADLVGRWTATPAPRT